MFTQADAREYARLVRELDGRSSSRARRPLFVADPSLAAPQTPATVEWRAKRARQRPEVDAELRLAREWLRLRADGALPVEAVRAARRCGDGQTTGDEDDGGSEDAHSDDSEAGAPPPRKSKKRRGALRPGRRRSGGRNAGEGAGSIEPR